MVPAGIVGLSAGGHGSARVLRQQRLWVNWCGSCLLGCALCLVFTAINQDLRGKNRREA